MIYIYIICIPYLAIYIPYISYTMHLGPLHPSGILEMARGHAHHEAVGAQHRPSRVARVDRGVDLDAHQAVRGDVDAAHHSTGHGDVLAPHREADAGHVVVQLGDVARELQGFLSWQSGVSERQKRSFQARNAWKLA